MERSDSRELLIYEAKLTQEDIEQANECRGSYNRLGFAYQIGFVRLMNRNTLNNLLK